MTCLFICLRNYRREAISLSYINLTLNIYRNKRRQLMEKKQIVSNKQVKLEIEMIINRKLFQNKVIDREVYENVQEELLREINKEMEKV